jgi:hypothetical protein
MALATLSPENRIKTELAKLGCAERNFAVIAGVVGKSRFAEGMAGQKDFEHRDAERILEVLEEMRELQAAVGDVPIDWSRVDRVQTALVVRRVAKIASEFNDQSMNAEAARATQSLK